MSFLFDIFNIPEKDSFKKNISRQIIETNLRIFQSYHNLKYNYLKNSLLFLLREYNRLFELFLSISNFKNEDFILKKIDLIDKFILSFNIQDLKENTGKQFFKIEKGLRAVFNEIIDKFDIKPVIIARVNNITINREKYLKIFPPEFNSNTFSWIKERTQLEGGDILRVKLEEYFHFGIYAGDNKVIHYCNESDSVLFNRDFTIKKTDISIFSKFEEISVMKTDSILNKSNILLDAESKLGLKEYDIIFNNCEHFVNKCAFGLNFSNYFERILVAVKRIKEVKGLNRILLNIR